MQYAKPVTLNVEECDRLSFLPYLFGNDFLYAEAYVYALAQKMMPEYQGGFWHFIRLPDGGGYMMPDGDRFHLVNGENWFDRTVSADAAGIILTSLVINRQLWLYHDSGDAGLTHLYRMRDAQLWRHIEFHPLRNYRAVINARRREMGQKPLTTAQIVDEICDFVANQQAVFLGGHYILQGSRNR